MKIGGYYLFALLTALSAKSLVVIAEEATCTADGDCSVNGEAEATEESANSSRQGGCENKHDQCEFWASVGEHDSFGENRSF